MSFLVIMPCLCSWSVTPCWMSRLKTGTWWRAERLWTLCSTCLRTARRRSERRKTSTCSRLSNPCSLRSLPRYTRTEAGFTAQVFLLPSRKKQTWYNKISQVYLHGRSSAWARNRLGWRRTRKTAPDMKKRHLNTEQFLYCLSSRTDFMCILSGSCTGWRVGISRRLKTHWYTKTHKLTHTPTH